MANSLHKILKVNTNAKEGEEVALSYALRFTAKLAALFRLAGATTKMVGGKPDTVDLERRSNARVHTHEHTHIYMCTHKSKPKPIY